MRNKELIQSYVEVDSYNRTSRYLFPLIVHLSSINALVLKKHPDSSFYMVNLYLDDMEKPKQYPKNCLYCLVKVLNFDHHSFRQFFNNLNRHPNYLDYYNVDDGLIMLVIKIPEHQYRLVELFKQGRYSEFPLDYIEYFRPDDTPKIDCLFNVFTRSPLLKRSIEERLNVDIDNEAELDDIPYEEDEIFRMEKGP